MVRPPDSKQTKNLDFESREVVGISDTTVPGVQQGIDIGNQARHSKSMRELVSLAQQLKAQAPLRVYLPRCEESAVAEQRPGKGRPRAHCAVARQSVVKVFAGEIRPVWGASQHRQVKFSGAEAHRRRMVGRLPCIGK